MADAAAREGEKARGREGGTPSLDARSEAHEHWERNVTRTRTAHKHIPYAQRATNRQHARSTQQTRKAIKRAHKITRRTPRGRRAACTQHRCAQLCGVSHPTPQHGVDSYCHGHGKPMAQKSLYIWRKSLSIYGSKFSLYSEFRY
jgi:hypothetical protein